MNILKMMGLGPREMTREQLVDMVAKRLKDDVMMVQNDPVGDYDGKTIQVSIDLSEKRLGPEVARLKSDLIAGRADDLYQAIQGGTFPVERISAVPRMNRNGDGFGVSAIFYTGPERDLEAEDNDGPSGP